MNNLHAIRVCLLGVIASLVVIGILSATPISHSIQVSPLVIVFILVMLGKSWSNYAALPLFVFWLVIVMFIWLYLLGVANIVSGTFSRADRKSVV